MDRGAWRATVHGVRVGHDWRSLSNAKSCLLLCHPRDYSPWGSSVHGISQARILGWVVISFSRGSFWPRDQTWVSCTSRWILYRWAIRETQPGGLQSMGSQIQIWLSTHTSIRFPLPLKLFYELSYATWASNKDKNRLSCNLGRYFFQWQWKSSDIQGYSNSLFTSVPVGWYIRDRTNCPTSCISFSILKKKKDMQKSSVVNQLNSNKN